ncbi:cytochrome b562 [Vibrio fluminensis]|uniref:cytochrome b562 n=1 Tax=Vibrio fluminensis TaxID=2783614 RepID=UPI001E4C2D16|nr:cytochrome b562 [Vibrio fluminensis]
MIRKIVLLSALFTSQAFAADYDLKSAMKQMKLDFKQAAEAQSVEEMQTAIDSFSRLITQSQSAVYPPEKQNLYIEGFNKLSLSVEAINQELQQGDLEGAKQELKVIDGLREEYHDKRSPSIWSKIFG